MNFNYLSKTCPWSEESGEGEIYCGANGDICSAEGCAVWHFVRALGNMMEKTREEIFMYGDGSNPSGLGKIELPKGVIKVEKTLVELVDELEVAVKKRVFK